MLFRDYTPLTNTRNTVTECPQTQSAQTHAYTDIPAGLYLYAVWFITPPLLARNTMFAGLAANLIQVESADNPTYMVDVSPRTFYSWIFLKLSENAFSALRRILLRTE